MEGSAGRDRLVPTLQGPYSAAPTGRLSRDRHWGPHAQEGLQPCGLERGTLCSRKSFLSTALLSACAILTALWGWAGG